MRGTARLRRAQRAETTGDERKFDPKLNLNDYTSKGIFDYAKFFLPMNYLNALAQKMDANGKAKHAAGKSGYTNWTVTVADVLQ